MKKFGRKRYIVQAKRRDTNEKWNDWTDTDNYQRALYHACRVEETGYLARIVVGDKSIEKLLDIVGRNEHEKVDAILDAGFRKQSDVAREIFDDIERVMCATEIKTSHGFYYSTDLNNCVAELKKKYTGG